MRWIPEWPRSGEIDPPPPPGRRDVIIVVLVALLVVADIPEDVTTWQPVSTVIGVLAAIATYWRRSMPLAALTVGFGAQFVAEVASGATDNHLHPTFGHVLALGILVYAVGRWAPWRAVSVAVAVIVVLSVAGELLTAVSDWDDQLNDALLWGMLAAIGIAIRYRKVSQRTRADQIRSEERERIARDLHDVVAHHVSAIALQAEGARAAAVADPAVATAALATIHETASTTLTEMRRMVAVLRDDSESGVLSPQTNLRELHQLFGADPQGLPVELALLGNIDLLPSSVTAAAWRIAQEAVTNARRHSRNATAINVVIEHDGGSVEIAITDDGDRVGLAQSNGYGIIGMTERCAMLGGTLVAGPLDGRGWQVHATIPTEVNSAGDPNR